MVNMNNKYRRSIARLFFISCAYFCILPLSLSAPKENIEQDPELSKLIYKSALHPYLQKDYFSGMTSLLVAKHKNLLTDNAHQAELLLGSLYLSYGMRDEAEAIFVTLAKQVEDPDILNWVWMQLGETYFEAQNYAKAQDALSRIEKGLPGSLDKRKTFIQGNALLELGKHEEAIELLTSNNKQNIWYYYGLYNIGIKLLNSEQHQTGVDTLNGLIVSESPRNKEIRILQDKARITLGYQKLRNDQPEEAMSYFSSISLDSPYSLWGLYGLGRSAYTTEKYKEALKYWLALEQHSIDEIPNIEAKLATSQLYFRLGALQRSLDGFTDTIDACDQELSNIDHTIELLSTNEANDASFLAALFTTPEQELSNQNNYSQFFKRPYFSELLASDEYHYLKQNYNDLLFYKQHLATWQQNMLAFNEILANRKKAFDEKLPLILNRHESLQLDSLSTLHASLSKQAQHITESGDSLALANGDEMKQLAKLEEVKNKLSLFKGHIDDKKYQRFHEKYALLAGVLQWNLDTDFKPRLRKLNKGVQEVASLLEETTRLDQSLKTTQKNGPKEFQSFERRITEYSEKISQLSTTVEELNTQILSQVQTLLKHVLEQQKEQISKLRTHAQFSVAQIYDLSVTNQKDNP